MPELPEVQRVVDTLAPAVVGRQISRAEIVRPDVVTPHGIDLCPLLCGRRVEFLLRRAKRIVFSLDDGTRFYVHLGMTGRLTLDDLATPRPKHTHAALAFDGLPDREVRFVDPRRFGGLFWLGVDADGDVGPEPLAMRAATLAQRLAGTRRAVKVALLDQRLVAGLGNIYVDESLHAAGLHPLTPACDLDAAQVRRLTSAIKRVLRRAIAAGGSTLRDYVDATGSPGKFQRLHRVYDRAGQPCRRCRGSIERVVLGGRSTHFCPTCQPVADPAGDRV